MFDPTDPGPDYELAWPPDLFVAEARAISAGRFEVASEVELLLEEAFTNDVPKNDYLASATTYELGVSRATAVEPSLLQQLVVAVGRLPLASTPAPYWRQRHRRNAPDAGATGSRRRAGRRINQLHVDWDSLVLQLYRSGYLERAAPRGCVDDRGEGPDSSDIISAEIEHRVGLGHAWPRPPGDVDWEDDEFLDLVEVLHDLVARPRNRSWHDFGSCGWHYSNFAVAPARILYRRRVNGLFARHDVGLRLADEGEDVGRLVRVLGDERGELLKRAVAAASPRDRASVEHAIALFRSRGASREEKRSACIALAGLLEDRRTLIKSELLSRDEGALFEIANNFQVRHRDARQHDDYDEAYLDWLFWIYLATTELTDRLAARGAP